MHNFKKVNYRSILKWTYIAGLFFSIFFYWPWSEVKYEIPKVIFSWRWIEILSVISFAVLLTDVKKEKLDGKLLVLILFYLVSVIISAYQGTDLTKSISGNFYRMDGVFTLIHLIILLFIVLIFSENDWLQWFSNTLTYSSIVLSVIYFVNLFITNYYVVGLFENWEGVYGLSFGNPNFLSGYLLVTLPFTYFLIRKNEKKTKLIYKSFLFTQIATILLIRSWAGIVGLILFAAGVLLIELPKYRKMIFTLSLLFTTLFVFAFYKNQKDMDKPNAIVAESRERIFVKGFLAFRERPIMGWGYANFDHAFDSVDWPIKFDDDAYVDKAHSSLLEILVTTGILGLLLYLSIIFRTIYNFTNKKEKIYRYLLFAFIMVVLHMQMNVVSISEEIIFWSLAGFSGKSYKG